MKMNKCKDMYGFNVCQIIGDYGVYENTNTPICKTVSDAKKEIIKLFWDKQLPQWRPNTPKYIFRNLTKQDFLNGKLVFFRDKTEFVKLKVITVSY